MNVSGPSIQKILRKISHTQSLVFIHDLLSHKVDVVYWQLNKLNQPKIFNDEVLSVGSVSFCQGLCAEACRLILLLMQWNVVCLLVLFTFARVCVQKHAGSFNC